MKRATSIPNWQNRWQAPLVSAGIACAIAIAAGAIVTFSGGFDRAHSQQVYGTKADVAHAVKVWSALKAARLVGTDRRQVPPTKGERPHGAIQQIADGQVRLDGAELLAVVKANHRGKGLTPAKVAAAPNARLTGYAIMIKRPGYNAQAGDWFWAVYNPNGSVRSFKGRAIAGRVDTGKTNGCIGCHRKEGGSDYRTLTPQ